MWPATLDHSFAPGFEVLPSLVSREQDDTADLPHSSPDSIPSSAFLYQIAENPRRYQSMIEVLRNICLVRLSAHRIQSVAASSRGSLHTVPFHLSVLIFSPPSLLPPRLRPSLARNTEASSPCLLSTLLFTKYLLSQCCQSYFSKYHYEYVIFPLCIWNL